MDAKQLLAEIRGSGLTQVEVAQAIGVSQGTVSKIERSQTKDLKANTYLALLNLHKSKVAGGVAKPTIVANVTNDGAEHSKLSHEVSPCR